MLPKSARFKTNISTATTVAQKKARLAELEAMADQEMPLEEAMLGAAEYLELEDDLNGTEG